MKSVRTLIADDHALVRAGIRALVEKIEGVTVVAERLARKFDSHAAVLCLTVQVPAHSDHEAKVVEQQRTQIDGEISDLVHRFVDHVEVVFDRRENLT